jgi:hypothetical protein
MKKILGLKIMLVTEKEKKRERKKVLRIILAFSLALDVRENRS